MMVQISDSHLEDSSVIENTISDGPLFFPTDLCGVALARGPAHGRGDETVDGEEKFQGNYLNVARCTRPLWLVS